MIDNMATSEIEAWLYQTPVAEFSDSEVIDIYCALYGHEADSVRDARRSLRAVRAEMRA